MSIIDLILIAALVAVSTCCLMMHFKLKDLEFGINILAKQTEDHSLRLHLAAVTSFDLTKRIESIIAHLHCSGTIHRVRIWDTWNCATEDEFSKRNWVSDYRVRVFDGVSNLEELNPGTYKAWVNSDSIQHYNSEPQLRVEV